MHVLRTSFNGNPNVGLYGYSTPKYLLVGPEVPKHLHADLKEVFKQEVKVITIAGTSLLGVFLVGNSRTLLVPDIAYEEEVKKIKDLGIPYTLVKTKMTCLGNNILANDNFAIISPEYTEREAKVIADALDVSHIRRKLVGVTTVGSVAIMNQKGCLLHYESEKEDIKYIAKKFKVHCDHGSVNLGNPYIKSGILLNDSGFIMGDLSGGPEIVHADRVFGFIE
ncbi:MAG: translation initiation factor IF-6 [Nanoarchaeota archaeon]